MSDYTKFNDPWVDADSATGGGDESTPIPAAALDHIEAGIDTAHSELQAHLDDTSDAHDASAISIADAAGDFTATDVEGALAEIQTDVEALQTDVEAVSAALGSVSLEWRIVFFPLGAEAPASVFATLDTRNSHPVLDFDASTVEWTAWTGVLPSSYAGGGVNVKIIWAATSATSGNVIWEAGFERIPVGALDLDADSYATGQTASGAADSISGETTETTIALSNGAQMDSLAAGEMFRLYVQRNATNGSDTMTGDAELLAVVVTEQ